MVQALGLQVMRGGMDFFAEFCIDPTIPSIEGTFGRNPVILQEL